LTSLRPPPPSALLFPYTTLFRSSAEDASKGVKDGEYYFALEIPENFSQAVASPTTDDPQKAQLRVTYNDANGYLSTLIGQNAMRSEEHTSELQSRFDLVCRLLLE